MTLGITVIVCAHNEERTLPACLHSLLAQTRPPDELLVINNASTDETGAVARQMANVRVVDEPRKGLVVARETGRVEARGNLLVYVDADCRPPLTWLERIERHFDRDPDLVALSGPYRFYDWDWWGRALILAYDFTLAPATQVLVKHILRLGTIFYGGNFAARRTRAGEHRRIRHFDRVSRRRHQCGAATVWRGQGLAQVRLLSLHLGAPIQGVGKGGRLPPLRAQLHVRVAPSPPEGHVARRRADVMPGYEPFLLCDFHIHTRWSDGRLTLREVVDLYGETGQFDVIAITDHILMKKDLLARLGRVATLGRRNFGLREETFDDYLAEIRSEASRALRKYGMLVIPGAEVTQNSFRAKQNSHVIALGIKQYISADQPAIDVLREIRRQDGLSIACHPHHRTTRRVEISTCYLWDHRQELSDLVDVWEAANRDDLFSVTSLKHYPYVANSDFHKPKHLYSWKTLLKCDKTWPAVKRALRSNVDIALTLFRNGAWGAS